MVFSISDITRRKALAWTAFWKLEKICRSTSISIDNKIRLFNTTYVTVRLYGCESWILSVIMDNKKILLPHPVTGSCWASNALILWEIHKAMRWQTPSLCTSLDTSLGCLKLSHTGDMLFFVPAHGRRWPGWQRTSYIFTVQKLLGDTENDLHQDTIASSTNDWFTWRKFVVACSTAEWWRCFRQPFSVISSGSYRLPDRLSVSTLTNPTTPQHTLIIMITHIYTYQRMNVL